MVFNSHFSCALAFTASLATLAACKSAAPPPADHFKPAMMGVFYSGTNNKKEFWMQLTVASKSLIFTNSKNYEATQKLTVECSSETVCTFKNDTCSGTAELVGKDTLVVETTAKGKATQDDVNKAYEASNAEKDENKKKALEAEFARLEAETLIVDDCKAMAGSWSKTDTRKSATNNKSDEIDASSSTRGMACKTQCAADGVKCQTACDKEPACVLECTATALKCQEDC